jgi:hypothetical protein
MTSDPGWAKYPFWLAWYANESVIKVPKPWTKWTFWQYSGNGNGPQYGSQGLSLDMDYFNGTLDDLKKFAGISTPVPVPPTPPIPIPPTPNNWYAVRVGINANVHTQPVSTSPLAGTPGYILSGTKIQVDNTACANGYYHMLPLTGFLQGGYVTGSYLVKV